jgi:glycosyltransferase involved in cell wall biosynthesis
MLVSVCTPTYNRRPFIQSMIQCYEHQDYKGPKEWIIIDDGTDKIEDIIIEHIKNLTTSTIKYYKINEKLTLGKKRNLMHSYAQGDIIVYMDDDDYYPPQRISHAVHMLQSHPSALCAGSSILHVYFNHIKKIVEFGPYGPNHATAGTFAFKKELLSITSYDENASMAEEKHFLKNYTIPFVQLNPKKVILVCAHNHNTFDKRILLEKPDPRVVKYTTLNVTDFIKEPQLLDFYTNQIYEKIKTYKPGEPSMKQDVLEYMDKIKKEREFSIQFGNKTLHGKEILDQLNYQQKYIQVLTTKIKQLELEIKELKIKDAV